MTWSKLPHSGRPLVTSDRGALTLGPDACTVRRLVDDRWVDDVALAHDEDDADYEWLLFAVTGSRLVALRADGLVAEAEGSLPVRFFDAKRGPDASDLFALDSSASPAVPTMVTVDSDRSTWVLEGKRWRRVRSKVPRGDLVACAGPVGLFVLSENDLWSVTATEWSVVATFAGEPTEEDPLVPMCLACDPVGGLLLGATDDAIIVLGPDGWRRVAEAPGAVTHLAIDRVNGRLIAATESATYALALVPLGLSGWLPGEQQKVAVDLAGPMKLELTKEVVSSPDAAVLGTKRGEQIIALIPPNLVVCESSSGARMRVMTVGPDVLPRMPVLYNTWAKRLVACRVIADGSEEPSRYTRVGGTPQWIQEPEEVSCKRCKTPMRFRAQLCEDIYDCYFGDAGRVYVFDCAACGTADFVAQC